MLRDGTNKRIADNLGVTAGAITYRKRKSGVDNIEKYLIDLKYRYFKAKNEIQQISFKLTEKRKACVFASVLFKKGFYGSENSARMFLSKYIFRLNESNRLFSVEVVEKYENIIKEYEIFKEKICITS